MSSMAPVYRGEVFFGKQIYTMHSTVEYTHTCTQTSNQQVVCDEKYLETKV